MIRAIESWAGERRAPGRRPPPEPVLSRNAGGRHEAPFAPEHPAPSFERCSKESEALARLLFAPREPGA